MASGSGSSGLMPALLGLVAAVLLWWVGDQWREERAPIEAQVATTQRLLAHRETESMQSLERQRELAALLRQALVDRLNSGATMQMARAGLFYEIRQKCYEIKLNCQIRLAEAIPTASPGAGPVTSGAATNARSNTDADPLLALGIERVRATVSGAVENQDVLELLKVFLTDSKRQWRINRMQIKGQAFEFDLELHVIPARSQ
jgi:hypothetical protein